MSSRLSSSGCLTSAPAAFSAFTASAISPRTLPSIWPRLTLLRMDTSIMTFTPFPDAVRDSVTSVFEVVDDLLAG